MKRGVWIAAAMVTGLMALGCEEKTEAEKAAENASDTANKKLEEAQDHSKAGTDAAKERADELKAGAKEGADAIQSSIDDLVGKAQGAVKDMKWTDAENYVKQIDDLKGKLPEAARTKVDAALTEVKKAIELGKKAPAIPGT